MFDLSFFYMVNSIFNDNTNILYLSINTSKKGILRGYQVKGQAFDRAFMGSAFVDWLVKSGMVDTKERAIITGRQLLENDIIRHGSI